MVVLSLHCSTRLHVCEKFQEKVLCIKDAKGEVTRPKEMVGVVYKDQRLVELTTLREVEQPGKLSIPAPVPVLRDKSPEEVPTLACIVGYI